MEALQDFLQQQTALLKEVSVQIKATPASPVVTNVPWPAPLEVSRGNQRENLEFFLQSWEDYEVATGMDRWKLQDENKKISTFFTALGNEALVKYNRFNLTAVEKTSLDTVKTAITLKIMGEHNVIYERAMFNSHNQSGDEAFCDYYSKLQKLISTCDYGTMKDDLLRDRIVLGICKVDLKKKLMSKPKLTLKEAVDLCMIEEATNDRLKDLKIDCDQSVEVIKKKHQGSYQRDNREAPSKTCKFCALKHEFKMGKCPAYSQTCKNCGGWNHFAIVCKKEPRKFKRHSVKNLDSKHPNEYDDSDNSEEEEHKVIKKVVDNSSHGGKVYAFLKIQWSSSWENTRCQLDTGADACVIGMKNLLQLTNSKKIRINGSDQRLYNFDGNKINTLGTIIVKCVRKGKIRRIEFQVTERDHIPLLSANACTQLQLVKYCDEVITNPKIGSAMKETEKIVKSYADLFEGFGCIPGETTLTEDESVTPKISPARRIPFAVRDKLKEELDRMVKEGVIVQETEPTKWVSNILMIQKNDKMRICLDPIPLNKALVRPNLQFTTLDEILPELGKAKIFSTVDIRKGFWHIKLAEASSKLTTFWTPFGRFRWLRLPFGINTAPEIFEGKMLEIISGLKGIEKLADDFLIFGIGDTVEEATQDHNSNLKNLFERLRSYNCRLNKEKMQLCKKEVNFFGHILSDKGVQPDETKIEAIKMFPTPKTKKELHRFIGMVTYLHKFIKNLSIEFKGLRELIKTNTEWVWTAEEELEFNRIKHLVADCGTLKYYDRNKPITIECDASSYGLGAVLLQEDGVIAYGSRTLTATEQNYAQIEKEMLAIVYACTRFNQMLSGNPRVTIKTDHRPIVNIFRKSLLDVPKRLQKMLLTIQKYSIDIQYVKGSDNVVADALSRAPCGKDTQIYNIDKKIENISLADDLQISDERIDHIKSETEKDKDMQLLLKYIRQGWPRYNQLHEEVQIFHRYKHELSAQNGLVFKGSNILIPKSIRTIMLQKLHLAHSGIEMTLKLARNNIFWPGMSKDIHEFLAKCATCRRFQDNPRNAPMMSHEVPSYPFEYVSLDAFFVEEGSGKATYLVTVDHFSDFIEVDKLRNLSPEQVIYICKKNFSRFGVPRRVCTDNGTNFKNQKFKEFSEKWGFQHATSSPHHQQGNGKAEAAVKVVKKLMKKSAHDKSDFWYNLLNLRNTPNKTDMSPTERMFNRQTRCSIPTAQPNLESKQTANTRGKIKKLRDNAKKYYDKRSRPRIPPVVGQKVTVKINPKGHEWEEGRIIEKHNERSFVVDSGNNRYRRSLLHVNPVLDEAIAPQQTEAAIVPDSSASIPIDNAQGPRWAFRSRSTIKKPSRFNGFLTY